MKSDAELIEIFDAAEIDAQNSRPDVAADRHSHIVNTLRSALTNREMRRLQDLLFVEKEYITAQSFRLDLLVGGIDC